MRAPRWHTSLPNLSAGQALKGHERDSDRPLAILVMALPVGARPRRMGAEDERYVPR